MALLAKERAERLFHQKQEGDKAARYYRSKGVGGFYG